ncbi:hypothetical protein N657DRAFT_604547 [Parathielavia appendiculata]|uniref:RING-type domain-containing protein n=1 Tax=Parathielavia appendiculata TaxID=2587402 RepID=A0AAN6TRN8_9PEZI|nr:hypothetical protein N657DRAFT_604547 [Parathielavia appendiculata]
MATLHVTTIDLTGDNIENCWFCHEVVSEGGQSRTRYLLEVPAEESGYVICADCTNVLPGSNPLETVKLYGDRDCPICWEERALVAVSCGHTFCESCIRKASVCPICRSQSLRGKRHIRVTRCGVARCLPHPTVSPTPPARPPGTTGSTNIFRVGELVWYRHTTTWRLGVVLSITTRPDTTAGHYATDSRYDFTLAPLGHAMIAQANVVEDCQSMRPFLTYLIPPLMNQLKDFTFDMVDWEVVITRCMEIPDVRSRARALQHYSIEASKLAARAINASYSTYGLSSEDATVDATLRTKTYEGVYLGAEMIRVGDPVRVNTTIASQAGLRSMTSSPTLVMLVKEIQLVETFQQQPCSTLYFRGDVYCTIRSTLTQPFPPGTVRAGTLGPAFVEELTTLNTIETDRSMRWSWVMVESQKLCCETDVQGRFYVTEKLMRIIAPERYEMWVENGRLGETPLSDRGKLLAGRHPERRPGRAAALGEAVSVQFRPPHGMTED